MALRLQNLLLFLLFISVGCSSVRVSQDFTPGTNLSGLRTYAWHSDRQEATAKQPATGPTFTSLTCMQSAAKSAPETTRPASASASAATAGTALSESAPVRISALTTKGCCLSISSILVTVQPCGAAGEPDRVSSIPNR